MNMSYFLNPVCPKFISNLWVFLKFEVENFEVLLCLKQGGKYTTILPAKSDSDDVFCLQKYQGLMIDRSLVY